MNFGGTENEQMASRNEKRKLPEDEDELMFSDLCFDQLPESVIQLLDPKNSLKDSDKLMHDIPSKDNGFEAAVDANQSWLEQQVANTMAFGSAHDLPELADNFSESHFDVEQFDDNLIHSDIESLSISEKSRVDREEIGSQKTESLEWVGNPSVAISHPSDIASCNLVGSSTLSTVSPSCSTSTTRSLPIRRPGFSLRKRKPIQLKPFTIESTEFNRLLSVMPSTSKLKNTRRILSTSDDSDTEFVPEDSQCVDEHLDEIPLEPKKQISPSILEVARQKYVANPLVIPIRVKDKMKPKPITFQLKKKNKGKKAVRSRVTVNPVNDIFDFNLYSKTSAGSSIVSNPSTGSNSVISDLESDEEEDEVEEEEGPIFIKHRIKRKTMFANGESSDDDEDESEQEESVAEELTQEELDKLFAFPDPPKRYSRNNAEDEIVPIIDDASEYRENKRQRMGIKDLRIHALKNVLPASYYKLNEKKFNEELRSSKTTKPQKKDIVPVETHVQNNESRIARTTEDVFAQFRGSQSDDSDEEHEENNTLATFLKPTTNQTLATSSNLLARNIPRGESTSYRSHNVTYILDNALAPSSSTTTLNVPNSSTLHRSPEPIPRNQTLTKSKYPEEAMEDNRMAGQRGPATGFSGISTPKRSTVKSSTGGVGSLGSGKKRTVVLYERKGNPKPLLKNRKRRAKRTSDDIYIHAPYFSHWTKKSRRSNSNEDGRYYGNGNQNGNVYGTDNGYPYGKPRAVDDICLYTKPKRSWQRSGLIYIRNYDIKDYLIQKEQLEQVKQLTVPIHDELELILKRVHLGLMEIDFMDVDFRGKMKLRDTVYLHQLLFQPLLTSTPDKKSDYIQFQKTHSELQLFGHPYPWREIAPENNELLEHFFDRIFNDMTHVCFKDEYSLQTDLEGDVPHHEHFFIFVSLCLAQWIPCHSKPDQLLLLELFVNRIQGLACNITKMAQMLPEENTHWKAIVKLLVYILDWSCRLHHLGVDGETWSVTDCTQMILDVLVHIGYDPIKQADKDYLIEPWLCLFQIMAVSTQEEGYYFHPQVFASQMTLSIERKSRASLQCDVDIKPFWIENMNIISKNYFSL